MASVTPLSQAGAEAYIDPEHLNAPDAATDILDPKRMLGAIRRRKFLIVGIMVLITGLATLYVNQLTPLYSATATIVVEGARKNIVGLEAVSQGLTPDFYTNETEAAIIASRTLAEKAVDRLDLSNNPLFNPELEVPEPGLTDSLKARLFELIGLGDVAQDDAQPISPWEGMSAVQRKQAMREYMTDSYLGGLSVAPAVDSRVIAVSYVSSDPAFAALAANTTAQLYILDQLAAKGNATTRAAQWLNQRVKDLRQRVLESERRLEEFRRKSGIVDIGGITILQEQASKLNTELFVARNARSEIGARYNQVQRLLKSGSDIETAAAIIDSALIQRLREQEVEILRKLGELKTQLREGHPRMNLAVNELAGLRQKIQAEVNKIAISLGNEVEIAGIRERNISSEIDKLQKKINQQNDAEVTLRALMSESAANVQLYETVLARFKETDVFDDELQQADARVISAAVEPGWPFYPQKNLMIVAALMVSALLGVALTIVLELLDSGFRGIAQLESVTGLPTVGSIPSLTGEDRKFKPHQIAVRRPNSIFGEAIRTIRTALMLSSEDHPPKTILVTSSVPGEGKSSTALSIVASAARSGQRAIIVDGDLRNPSIHVELSLPIKMGLSDFIGGRAKLQDIIEIDPESGMHVIGAGARASHPPDLLGSSAMRGLIDTLADRYDLVVIDLPPLLAASDALLLVRKVDRTIFVVRWEKTRRDTMLAAVRQVIEAGAHLAGLVLTQVDMKTQARYGYADTSKYGYYQDADQPTS